MKQATAASPSSIAARARRRLIAAGLAAVAALAGTTLPLAARAAYPERTVKLVVPFPAGGSLDVTARLLAEQLRKQLGQAVVIENIAGASGHLGTQSVARAAPDGYTVLIHTSALAINPWLSTANYDAQRDLMIVTRPAETAYVVVVGAESGPKTFDELLAKLKASPGSPCSTYGVGSPPHLAMEMLKQSANVDILHVPYRGFGPSLPDLVSGQLACGMDSAPNVLPHVRTGRVRALAVTSGAPLANYPGVPTLASKYPGLEVSGWQGIFVPTGTPRPVVERLNAEFAKALADPEVARKLSDLGFTTIADPVDDAARAFKRDYERYGEIIRSRNIKAQ
jgi:tripartite-type tricarboxylate transporter receptor subunit TctC